MVLVHSITTRDFIVHNHMTWFKGHNCTLSDALRIQCVSADSACGDGLEWTEHCLFAVLLTVLPFCLCLSLRPHPHCGQCVGGDEGGGKLGVGVGYAWCPTLQANWTQAAAIHWGGGGSCTVTVLDQQFPWYHLEETYRVTLLEWRGESSSDGQAILAQRYVHFLTTSNRTCVLWCLHLTDAYQYTHCPACVLLCAWLPEEDGQGWPLLIRSY